MGVCKKLKLLILLGCFVPGAGLLPVTVGATVTGVCSNCHTMHNSQQGAPMAYTLDSSGQPVLQDTPFPQLLKTDCVGCHTNPGPETIVLEGTTRIPMVYNLTQPVYPPDGSSASTLAGGNFHWLSQGDAFGHNVHGITGPDPRFAFAPGGKSRPAECMNCHGTLATPESGCRGCHVPHHHAGGPGEVAKRQAGWYRFLGSVMQAPDTKPDPPPEGVIGIEDPDWEQNPAPDRHNTYQGHGGPYVNYLESGSISQKCAGCHGVFHADTAADSAWIRHPVDHTIPATGEFAEFTLYNPMVPVARPGVEGNDANFSAIAHNSDLISCVSCHRPHGSPYPAMMRWGYRDWPGIDSHTGETAFNGCAVCHTAKD